MHCADLASPPEENDAKHDAFVATVSPVAEAELDSKVVPILFDGSQAVCEVPGSQMDRAPDGHAGLGIDIRIHSGGRSRAAENQRKCEVQDPDG